MYRRRRNLFSGGSLKRTEGSSAYTLSEHLQFCLFESQLTALSLTQATDTGKIKLVFAAIKETILSNSLKEAGVL
jgi:hypothetical protein